MRVTFWMAIRLLALLAAAWTLVAVVVPTGDPFVVVIVWCAFVVTALTIPPMRRLVVRWISTARVGR